ncbi:MAG: hypothetical protein IPM34_01970 [Saprospiraceae bacterium]|nr:hypothetical protein [Saprospiraceae bacterium]
MNSKLNLWLKTFLKNYSLAPLELKFFAVFCVCVTVLSLVIQLLFPIRVEESIIPITGWNMGMVYGYCVIVTFGPMVTVHGINRKLAPQYSNILLLAVFIIIHLVDIATWSGGYEDNPYLFRSAWRPVWTVVLPGLWIIILLSPRIKNYYQSLVTKKVVE